MPAELQGLQQLMNQFTQMGHTIENRTKEKALKAGAKVFQEKAKENVNIRTGNLRDNIVVSEVINDTVHVGPDQQGDAFYGLFLEFGRAAGTVKSGANKGHKYPGMDPRPFMGPTYENNKSAVQEEMKDVIKSELGL